MRTEIRKLYSYEDMMELQNMGRMRAKEVLSHAYRGYINDYQFPQPDKEYSEYEYDRYEIQCAFNLAYEYLERIEEDDKKI